MTRTDVIYVITSCVFVYSKRKECLYMGFLNNLINGISLGSIYAVIALGYTLVYGIAKMLNFAHGDVIMVGGYVIFTCMTTWGLNSWLSIVLAVIACTLLGIVIEKVAYKPLRQATSLAVLITAIGVSYFLQNIALLIFGEKPVNFTSVVNVPSIKLFDGQIVISGETSVAIIVSILIVVGLSLFINKTKSGRAMLAVSEDRGAAQLMGVNINRTISLTFAIGSGLAGIAGCSVALLGSIDSTVGQSYIVNSFMAVVLGGVGKLLGTAIGSVIIGSASIFTENYTSSTIAKAIVLLIVIIFLQKRPQGLFVIKSRNLDE